MLQTKTIIHFLASHIRGCLLFSSIILAFSLSGCQIIQKQINSATAEPSPPLSSLPIQNLSEFDLKFSQSALNQLGFKLGRVDGRWGPRSMIAIQKFEQQYQLESANGHLSELNLAKLNSVTTITREQIAQQIEHAKNNTNELTKKLDRDITNENSLPQLIIIEQSHTLFTKPNPYSEIITKLVPGSGIYILNFQQGWYEVESENSQHGFIQK